MFKKKLHLHSMMVHAVVALAPLAAIAFVLHRQDYTISSFGEKTWEVITWFSLITMTVISVPSIMTGLFERAHIYAKWHSTHKWKMGWSIILMAALILEIGLLAVTGFDNATLSSPLGLLLIVVNNVACFFLGFYGLKISMGRQGFGPTSYAPDLFKKDPCDILVRAGKLAKEDPVYIDLYEENR